LSGSTDLFEEVEISKGLILDYYFWIIQIFLSDEKTTKYRRIKRDQRFENPHFES